MTIEGLETYILIPKDPLDFNTLVDSVRENPRGTDIDVVVGVRGPLSTPETTSGLVLPLVMFDQLFSFDIDGLREAIPRPDDADSNFEATVEELFSRIRQMADNAGATDDHRALNYLAVRYPSIYEKVWERHGSGSSLAAVRVQPSRLAGARNVVTVVLDFVDRRTDVRESFFVRVDVTEQYPFLVTRLSPYYERA